MRYIDLLNNPPSQELIEEGKRLTGELMALSPEKRSQFIKDNSDYWGSLKKHYYKLSHEKCWYTEAKELASAYHMDHFRPKNATMELKEHECGIKTCNNDEPYWWLAFDWLNYRLSGSIPNSSKNCYFPLRDKSAIAKKYDDLVYEDSALIDPTEAGDLIWIAFDSEGRIYPDVDDEQSWEAKRVKISVRVYNLNYQPLVDQRVQIQVKCKRLIREIENIHNDIKNNGNIYAKKQFQDKVSELREMTKVTAELSATARNYILSSSKEYIRKLVAS